MDRNRRITFVLFLCLMIIYFMGTCSCTPQRMKQPVDYSYAQDGRDSVIARVHHYEVTHKEPTITNPKSERVVEITAFIIVSLILFLLQP